VSGPDRPTEGADGGGDDRLTPSDDEQEPDWAEQIRELRRQRGPRLVERLGDEDAGDERPLPDL
jgi:hypothetical protein